MQCVQQMGDMRLLASCGTTRVLIWGMHGCLQVVGALAMVAVCGTHLHSAAPGYGALWMEGAGRWAAASGIGYHVCESFGIALVTDTLTGLVGHKYVLRARWLIGLCAALATCVGMVTVADAAVWHSWGSQRLQRAGKMHMLMSCVG